MTLAALLSTQRTASLTVVFHWASPARSEAQVWDDWLSPGGGGSCLFSSSAPALTSGPQTLSLFPASGSRGWRGIGTAAWLAILAEAVSAFLLDQTAKGLGSK